MPDTDPRWEACRQGDREARNSIVEDCLPLVDQIVGSLLSKFPKHVEADDLRSYGVFGLIVAVETYDPSRAALRTHAAFRIRNYIFDELRKQDWAPKTLRARSKEIEMIATELQKNFLREPTEQEIGEALGKPVSYVRQVRQSVRTSHHKSMSELLDTSGEPYADVAPVVADVETKQEALAYMQQLTEWVASLPKRQQVVWALKFYENFAPSEIAEQLDTSQTTINADLRKVLLSFQAFVTTISCNR